MSWFDKTKTVGTGSRLIGWKDRKMGLRMRPYNLYRSPQILQNVYNNCYSALVAWMLGACMNILVVCLTVTIQVVPRAEPMANLQFPLGVTAILIVVRYAIQPLADFPSTSEEFCVNYRYWWGPGRALIRRKQRRSMRQFEAKCSILFVIQRQTLLEFWTQVVNNTVTLLLMT